MNIMQAEAHDYVGINGVKYTANSSDLHYTRNKIYRYTIYLHQPKESKPDSMEPAVRVKYSYNNFMRIPSPDIYYGTPEFERKVKEYALEFTNTLVARQKQFAALKPKRKDKKNKDPYLQELMVSFSKNEMLDLNGNNDAIAERMEEAGREIIRKYTYKKEIHNDCEIKIHIKKNGIHDMHLRIGYYDYSGDALKLRQSKKRLAQIRVEMENNPKFSYLEKITTAAHEKQAQKFINSENQSVAEQINSIIKGHRNDPKTIKQMLIQAGFVTTPYHFNNQLKDVTFTKKGTDYQAKDILSAKDYVEAIRFIELVNFEQDSGLNPAETIPALEAVIEAHKGKSLEDLSQTFDSLGWMIDTNFSEKKNKAQGYSFVWKDTNSKIKSSRIAFNIKDFTTTPEFEKNLDAQYRIHVKKFRAGKEIKKPLNMSAKQQKGKKSFTDYGIGRKKRYQPWRMHTGETIEEFIARIRADRSRVSLIQNITMVGAIGFNSLTKRDAFKALDNGHLQVYQNNASTMKSALQYLLAANVPTQSELASGVQLTLRISGGTFDMREQMWFQAKLMNIPIEGHTPSPAIQKKAQDALDARLAKDRAKNRENLEKFMKGEQDFALDNQHVSTGQTNRLRIQFNSNLDVEVDRRAVALAYVDAFLMRLNPDVVINPPHLHELSRNKATAEDLSEHIELMRTEVKLTNPDRLLEFDTLIARYKPLPPEPAMPNPPEPAEIVVDYPDYEPDKVKPKPKL